tara:strand:+ start:643 stop:807 length:165 start_codon:yes stop_codon:yes gene_type:complete
MNLINVKSVNVIAESKIPKDVNAALLSEIKTFYHRITALETDNSISSLLFLFAK